jgi:hypothetical protein
VDYVNGAGNRNRTRVLRITRALLWSSVSYCGKLLNGRFVIVVELEVVLSATTFVFEAAGAKHRHVWQRITATKMRQTRAQRELEIIWRAPIRPLDIFHTTAESIEA